MRLNTVMKQLWRFTELGDHEWHEISRRDRESAWRQAQLAWQRYDAEYLELLTLNLQTELLLTQLDSDFDPETLDPRWVQRALFLTAVAGLQGQGLLADIDDVR
jgi:hypothetical protein